ncbi:MAG: hypothetical protein QM601_07595 [Pseudoxanthomonas sp.]
MSSPASRHLPPLAAVLLFVLLAMLQICVWIWLSLRTGGLWGGMALALAAAAALSLRWAGMAAGWARVAWAVLATAAATAVACWLVIAAQVGLDVGTHVLSSAGKLGPRLAWTLLRLAATPADRAALLAAPLLAGLAVAVRAAREPATGAAGRAPSSTDTR